MPQVDLATRRHVSGDLEDHRDVVIDEVDPRLSYLPERQVYQPMSRFSSSSKIPTGKVMQPRAKPTVSARPTLEDETVNVKCSNSLYLRSSN